MASYRKIQSFLQQANPRYRDLLTEYRNEKKTLHSIQKHLGQPLGQHCIAMAHEGKNLVLYCDAPVWHSRLRLQAPQLLQFLRHQLKLNYSAIVCKTSSTRSGEVARNPAMRQQTLPPDAAQQMQGLADSLDAPQLSAALRRLSRRSKL